MGLEVDGEAALHPGVLEVTPHDGGAGRRVGARQGREQILTEEVKPVRQSPLDAGSQAEPLPWIFRRFAVRSRQSGPALGHRSDQAWADRGVRLHSLEEA